MHEKLLINVLILDVNKHIEDT